MANDFNDSIGGYPLLDDGGPFPGGKVFATKHPTRDTPMVLRRYRGEWFAPADSLDGFHSRVRETLGIEHPNLVTVKDSGFVGSDVFVVLDPLDGATLEALVKDIGPMPTFLAAEFTRHAALALELIHQRGHVHGDVRPAHLVASPLIDTAKTRSDGSPIQRPAANALAKLTEFGLVPKRPGGREWAALDPLSAKPLGFLPPERVASGTISTATDIYGLGATLFFLLTGRAPYVANSADGVINAIDNTPPAPLATLRPDLPVGLVDLVNKLIARTPGERPQSAREVAALLAPFAEPEPVTLTKAPTEAPNTDAWADNAFANPEAAAVEASVDPFHPASRPAPAVARKKTQMTAAERAKLKLWLYLGLAFWLVVAPLLWFALLSDGCAKKKEPGPKPDSSSKKSAR